MYDFQHQDIYVYDEGSPVSYQWYARRRGQADTEYISINSATSATMYVPANFIKNVFQPIVGDADANYNDSIIFTCVAKYADGTFKNADMDIEFIGTNTSGYATDPVTGVKYLALQKAPSTALPANTLQMALLNLGQSEGNDATDLGDFYQWGRIADGHQHIVWRKDTDHKDNILPFGTFPDNTSETILRSTDAGNLAFYDSNGQIPLTTTDYYGKFIYYSGSGIDWGIDTDAGNGRWGNNLAINRANSENPASNVNDPCPSGWRVPSRYQIWDTFNGDGNDTNEPVAGTWTDANNNKWQWRDAANNAVGGALITNASGERVFLPATGYRSPAAAAVGALGGNLGLRGYYWNSEHQPGAVHRGGTFSFTIDFVYAGNFVNLVKANGFPVRCVKE
jgi:uncharacterized protein (TIGR02145 family)